MNNFVKRFISSLLATLTIVSLIPFETLNAYGSGGSYVGDGSGFKVVTGSGDFDDRSSGYRFWLMGKDGKRVPGTRIVDIRYREVTQSKPVLWTYNTKVEPWTGTNQTITVNSEYIYALFDDVNNIPGIKGQMPRPVIDSGGFKGQGTEFRDWLTKGKECYQPSGSTGGVVSYKPYTGGSVTTRPGVSTGGNTTQGNTESSDTTTKPYDHTKDIASFVAQFNLTVQNKVKLLNKSKGIYTRKQALASLKSQIYASYHNYLFIFENLGYPKSTLTAAYVKANSSADSMLDKSGWKTAKQQQLEEQLQRTDAIHIISSLFDTAYAIEDSITETTDGSFIIDFAYAAIDTGIGEAVQNYGNLPILMEAKLADWLNALNNPNIEKKDTIDKSFGASGIKLIIEPIVWFQPATLKSVGVPGTSPEWRFYGTPTTYASMMEYNKANGLWHDGNGKGGYNHNPMNAVTSVSLYIAGDLSIPANEKYIQAITPPAGNKEVMNSDLQYSNLGYAMHYVMFGDDSLDVPRTHTYDYSEYDPNPAPHQAPDPSPEKIPLCEGEPNEPGDPITPTNPKPQPSGYRNMTRSIHIVKVYDILKDNGTLEHVETHDRDFNPGTITVEHEEDYKCVGYFTSEQYYGFTIAPIIKETPWEAFRNNKFIPINQKIFWETEYDQVSDKKAKEVAGTVIIGLAADPEYDPAEGREPNNGYKDSTLYVHLVKKETIPETSTYDEPDNPPTGTPPVVPPHPAEDPKKPGVNDPETDPVEPNNPYCHYRIVKVYETLYKQDNKIETDQVFETYETNPIVYIQDEGQKATDGKDNSWHLIKWLYGDEFEANRLNSPNEPRWETIIQPVTPKDSGIEPERVNLIDNEDSNKTVTLYIRLRRTINDKTTRTPGQIYIEQSQISKAIHSNDKNIGGRFGDYKFDISIGNFTQQHINTYQNYEQIGYDVKTGQATYGYVSYSRTCQVQMPGANGDSEVNFVFDEIGAQHSLEVKLGVHSKTDSRVYGNNGSSGTSKSQALQYKEKVETMFEASNHKKYSSDGKTENGAEYVTVLWRGGEPMKDLPTLAKFKERDIKDRYGADNWEIPNAMLKNADRKSRSSRAREGNVYTLKFEFGFDRTHNTLDSEATASCINLGNGTGGCVYQDKKEFHTMDETQWAYTFEAKVAIQFYAGKAKATAAEAPSKSNITGLGGKHYVSNVYQGTEKISFYPYIRMTYMLPNLDDAIGEEDNTYNTGHPNPNVRYDTYVLSEYESSILPSDAIQLGWRHKNGDENTLSLTSQQWSLHKRAISGSDGWQGRNQVLPGGAIYQLATKKDDPAIVQIITYNTIVDDKARQEYLTANNTISANTYTVDSAVADLKEFVNDAKEVLDNLNVVQWVNKNANASTAWSSNFAPGNGTVKLAGKGEDITQLENRTNGVKTANLDDKYYLRGNTFTTSSGEVKGSLTDFQSAKISDRTYEIRKQTGKENDEQSNSGDLDVSNIRQVTTVWKVFTDTQGNVYYDKREKTLTRSEMDNAKQYINDMINEMKDINGDNLGGSKKICSKTTSWEQVNGLLPTDLRTADNLTKYVTNIVKSVTRNTGDDPTASWVGGPGESKWYNEAFDGFYLVKQRVDIETSFQYSPTRVAVLDPALCPTNRGQSDLYTKAFLSQFCLDSQSDAAIAEGKPNHYIGTYKGQDMFLPDMELMYQSKKFYIPNANVQDLN